MKTQMNLGVWIDYATANFIDLKTETNRHSITSRFTFYTKEEALNRSKNLMPIKRLQMHEAYQQMYEDYYKEIAVTISQYNHVLLFGPTHAKSELHTYLNKDLHFKDIKFDIESAEKMSDNEKDAFVKNHFENIV